MHDWPRIDFCAEAVDGSIAISGGRNWWTGERLSDVWLSRGHLLAVRLHRVRRGLLVHDWVDGADGVRGGDGAALGRAGRVRAVRGWHVPGIDGAADVRRVRAWLVLPSGRGCGAALPFGVLLGGD